MAKGALVSTLAPPRPSPYVGPRAFERGERLFGRDQELARLVDLVIAERIVLLYSPSGAGKTSLLRAGLVPQLEREGFRVLPEIRVTAELAAVGDEIRPRNRYLMSTLLSLEQDVPVDRQQDLDALARMTLVDYLSLRRSGEREREEADSPTHDGGDGSDDDGGPDENIVLILDQFEELLMADVTDQEAKASFMAELGAALRDRHCWAVFAMREDFIAGLDPFRRLVPTRLRTTFRLDLLREDAARMAIQGPAREAGVDFSDAAARMLVDDLRKVRVSAPDGAAQTLGPYIEPVQLQVVCERLWSRPRADPQQITESDLEGVEDVDHALASYYAERIHAVVIATGADERALRDWFDQRLISEQGFRSQVIVGPSAGAPDGNHVLRLLEDAHLLRAEIRRGARWFELAHDRLVEPVRASNAEWRETHLQPFQRQAALWESQGRLDALLLTDDALIAADEWVDGHPGQLTSTEQEFLAISRRARDERQRGQRTRLLALGLVGVLALVGVLTALSLARRAESRALASQAMLQLAVDPAAAVSTALAALDEASTQEAEDALRRTLPESHLRTILSDQTTTSTNTKAAFSPNGRLVVTISEDAPVQVWDTTTGQLMTALKSPYRNSVTAVAFDPSGARVVTAGRSQAQIWDIRSGRHLLTLTGHQDLIRSVEWSTDGARVITASQDGTARVWSAETGEGLQTLARHTSGVTVAMFSPDGQRGLTAALDGTVRIWDLQTGREVSRLDRRAGAVFAAAFSPDGTRVVAAGENRNAYLWEWAADRPPIPLPGHNGDVAFAQFSRDGRYVATAGGKTARLWDARDGASLAELRGHTDRVSVARFSSESALLVTAGYDGTARVWDVASGAQLAQLRGHASGVYNAVFAPGGGDPFRVRVVTASFDGTARVWEPLIGRVLHGGVKDGVRGARFSADGRLVVGAGADGVARVWRARTGEELAALQASPRALSGAALSRDGRYVVTGGADGVVRVWDCRDWQACGRVAERPLNALVSSVEFDSSGRLVAIAGGDMARVWEWGVDAPPRVFSGHRETVSDAAFSRDGRRLVTASADRTVQIWDVSSGVSLRRFTGPTGFTSAAFSPNGRLVVTAGFDGAARVWDVATGKEWGVPLRHGSRLSDAAFSPDGGRIVTGAADGSAGVWDAATARSLGLLGLHADPVNAAQFSPDGRWVLTASDDGTARVYGCPTCVPRLDELRRLAGEQQRGTRANSPHQGG